MDLRSISYKPLLKFKKIKLDYKHQDIKWLS